MLNENRLIRSIIAHSHIDRVVKLILPVFKTDVRGVGRNIAGEEGGQYIEHG